MNSTIAESMNQPQDPACSFCRAPEKQVGMLIAGDRHFICDRCAVAAVESIFRQATGRRRPSRRRTDPPNCCFCHRLREETNLLVRGDHAVICDRCIGRIIIAVSKQVRGTGEPPVLGGSRRAAARD
jgi:ATP-dependent protease Clp ATPase subunit